MKRKENYIKYFTDYVDEIELPAYVCQAMFNLMKVTNLGRNSALKIRKEIITDLEDKGYKLPCGLIPMCEVINKLNININYLQNMVRMEVKWYL